MKLNLLLPSFIFIFCIINSCNLERIEIGSGNQSKFETTIGGGKWEAPNDIITISDGGYLVAGVTQSFTATGDNQAYLVKLDSKGTQVWESNFGGTADDYARAVVETSDKGYILCGYTESFNANNNYDIYLVKVDSEGKKVWEKSYGAVDTAEIAVSIIPVGSGDYYILYVTSDLGQTVNLLRINANGSKISTRIIKTGVYYAYRMIKTSDGKIVIVGSLFNGNGTNSFILKLNEDGTPLWEKDFSGPINNFTPSYSVAELSNKDLVLAGSYLGSNDHDFNLISYNGIGGNLWDESWGGASADELFGIVKSTDNQLVVLGYTGSFSGKTEFYLSKRNSIDGSKIWEKNFIEIANQWLDIANCSDGGYILCAGQNATNADIIIVKTDANGNYQ